MTDKEKIKLWAKGRLFEIMNGIGENDAKNILTDFLPFIDSMQEEPTTSVWHNITEEPKMGKWILFRHSEGWYHVGRKSKGRFKSGWFSDGCSAFPCQNLLSGRILMIL